MDEALGRRLDAIERRLTEIEAQLAGKPAAAAPRVPADPSPTVVAQTIETPASAEPEHHAPPPLPPHPLVVVPAIDLTALDAAIAARVNNDRYAENMRQAYGGDLPSASTPPSQTPPAVGEPRPDGPPMMSTYHNQRLAAKQAMLPVGSMPPPLRRPAMDLEQMLGLKWAGWLGAVVLIVGSALGVKYAYDQGWLGGMPPAARCVLIALAGMGLIGLGEYVYRRINRISATGLYGAGVAVLYLAAYAGEAWYTLYAPPTAFVLMGLASVIGMAIAARADMVSIAVLAVLGAGFGPPMFFGGDRHPPGFLAYLLAIQVLAIGLCAWRGTAKWWVLRSLAFVVTTLWMLDRPLNWQPGIADAAGLAVALLMALIYQGELIYSTLRRTTPNAGAQPGPIFSFFVTVGLIGEWMSRLQIAAPVHRGEALLAFAATVFVLARLLRGQTLRRLSRGFDVQGVLLLVLAVPVALHGPAVFFGWLLLTVALALLAMLQGDKLAISVAVALWVMTAIGLFVWADQSPVAMHAWLHTRSEPILAVVFIAAAVALCGHVTAFAVRWVFNPETKHRARDSGAIVLDIAAVVVAAIALAQFTSPNMATHLACGYALVLAIGGMLFVPQFELVSLGLLGVVAIKWASLDVLRPRLARDWTPLGRPFWNAQTATGVWIAAMFGLLGLRHRHGRSYLQQGNPVQAQTADMWLAMLFSAAVLIVTFAASVEVDRAIVLSKAAGGWTTWPGYDGQLLVWSAVWAGVLAVWMTALRLMLATDTVRRDVVRCASLLGYLLAVKFVVVDVIAISFGDPAPTPALVLNLRTGVAVAVIAVLALVGRRERRSGEGSLLGLAVLVVLLVTGSAEVDRYAVAQHASPAWIVRQVGWSIYWALLAVGTLIVGFGLRERSLRMAALGLLGVTLLKLVLVDLSGAGTGWRILSFLGLGVVLLLTSVLYGRFKTVLDPPNDVERLS